jgi:hypothetical protein
MYICHLPNCRFNTDNNASHYCRLTWALGLSKNPLWKQLSAMSKSLENSSIARPREWPRHALPAITPIGARHRSGSGNATTEPGHGRENHVQELPKVFSSQALRHQPNRAFKGTPDISHRFGNSERGAP